jgi:hypothetical protein
MLNIYSFGKHMTEKIKFSFNIEQNNRISLFYGNYGNHARLTALSQCTVVSHVVPLQFDFLTLVYTYLSATSFTEKYLPQFLCVHSTDERFRCKHLAEI